MKKLVFLLVLIACLVGAFALFQSGAVSQAGSGDDQSTGDSTAWMKKKLEHSQGILSGLVSGDFELIVEKARTMQGMNLIEGWLRSGDKEYRSHIAVFSSANLQLLRMAEEENIDGAALAYLQLTMSCVNCHKFVRDTESPRD